jgi:tetratricopeptide (TPR) repeat protein
MHRTFRNTLAVVIAGALAAFALESPDKAQAQSGGGVETPRKPTRVVPRDRAHNLDFLFEALKAAPDETSAKAVEERIAAIWLASKSDTANLLMTRAIAAIEARDFDLALELLNAIVVVAPNYAEAWNRRATIYYLKNDYGRAVADIRRVLSLEPRHFGAMAGLGRIFQSIGDDKHALEIYRRALAINPHLQRIPDLVKTLTEKVEGRDI